MKITSATSTEGKQSASMSSSKKSAKPAAKKGEEDGADTRVEIKSKKVSADPKISGKDLSEAEKLMEQVNSGKLSETEHASALKRVGQILGRQGNA